MAIYALLVGINYTTNTQYRLYGCINDCLLFNELLLNNYGVPSANIVFLRDDLYRDNTHRLCPTGGNILREFRDIVRRAQSGDTVYIHFSGHGSNIRDLTGEERDGIDEFIVPVDYFTLGTVVRDDDINEILSGLARNVRVYMVFDSCHSGTIADLGFSYYATKNAVGGAMTFAEVIENRRDPLKAKDRIICISGCRDNQQSLDIRPNGTPNGALSIALWSALKDLGNYASLNDLMTSIYEYLLRNNYTTQQPVVSCNQSVLLNNVFFMKDKPPSTTPTQTVGFVSTYVPPPLYYRTSEAELHIKSGVKPSTVVQNLLVELIDKKLLSRSELEFVFRNLYPVNTPPTRSEEGPTVPVGTHVSSMSQASDARYNLMRLFQ